MSRDSKDFLPFDGPEHANVPAEEAVIPDQAPTPPPGNAKHQDQWEKELEKDLSEYQRLVLPGVSLCSLEKESPLSINTRLTLEASGVYFKYQYNGKIFFCTSRESGRGHTPPSYKVSDAVFKKLNESAQKILDRIRSNQYRPTWHDDY